MLFGNEVRINELTDTKEIEKFLGLRYKKGCITVREVGSLFTTLLWVGTEVNVIIECGRLQVKDILSLLDRIEVFMFPTNRTSATKDIQDIKSVISDSNTWKLDNCIAFYNVWENVVNLASEHIKIAGHHGTWHVIDTMKTDKHGNIYLLEHETWGDECAGLIVDEAGLVLVDDVQNGFDDYEEKFSE